MGCTQWQVRETGTHEVQRTDTHHPANLIVRLCLHSLQQTSLHDALHLGARAAPHVLIVLEQALTDEHRRQLAQVLVAASTQRLRHRHGVGVSA